MAAAIAASLAPSVAISSGFASRHGGNVLGGNDGANAIHIDDDGTYSL